MASIINASPTNGIVQTADGSGVLKIQSNSVTTNALAWGTFQGASGTIDASYNVSSVTRNSTGDYTITYTNAMPNANYAWMGSCSQNLSGNPANFCVGYPDNSSLQTYSTTQTRVTVKAGYPSGMADVPRVTFVVFGN